MPDPTVKEEEIIDKLADDLSQVVKTDDEPDFSPDGPSQDQPPNNSSEPKEPDVSTTTAEGPANDQPTAANDAPATDPPTAPDTSTTPDATAAPPKTRMATGLSSLTPLEPLEAATDKDAPAPTPVKPTCKAAAIVKVALRQREFLVDNPQPTSEDEMPPPGLASFLRTTKPRSAAKRAPSVSATKRSGNAPPTAKRPQSASRSRSHGKKAEVDKGSGPIRPLSPKVADKSTGPIKPLAITADKPLSPLARKKPQSVLPNASAPKAENWRDQKHRFLQSTYDALRNSWDATSNSMAWTNLHVSGYFNVLPGLTHPRQLAACCLRSSSNETHRWSCWSCQLNPEEAKASGFSPSKSCWESDSKQLYHWWEVHAKQSHWDWVREAEGYHITHHELMCFLLGCDLNEWPLPWTSFALDALPRELPRKIGGHNILVFGEPYYRKLTSLKAPSEQYWQSAIVEAKKESTTNRPVSPPPPRAQGSITQLGWTNPVRRIRDISVRRTGFPPGTTQVHEGYGASRVAWHEDQCGIEFLTDFFCLTIEQRIFFLLYIKLVATLALSMPENFTGSTLRSLLGSGLGLQPSTEGCFPPRSQVHQSPSALPHLH